MLLNIVHLRYDRKLNVIALFQEHLPIFQFYLQAGIPQDIALFL